MLPQACKSDDPLPDAVLPDNPCDNLACLALPASAAVAVVRDFEDGGACSGPELRFSIPAGPDAFSSILRCGGNQVRCGSADYRVSSETPGASVVCAVTGSGPFHVNARVSQGNFIFQVAGDVDVIGGADSGSTPDASSGRNLNGSFTISAEEGNDGGAVGPLDCRAASIPFLLPGSIWASFDCTSGADPSACGLKGVFVFEHCDKEGDGGIGP